MAKKYAQKRERKYDAVTRYLVANGGSQVTLTFTQFDELLFPSSGLPRSAKQSEEWWANDYKYPEKGAYGWINASYEMVHVNLEKEYVVFNKLIKSNFFNGLKNNS